ncbi:ATP-binding protein [Marinobacter zhejiangensis]|uniref:histidine kinase n=1 Tax=Marinobacter zhejiangensis TaxID=488535 RepID=A0A1I4SYR0_9GAMM|nr:ATP-binding protein [Marinobacter zhejiangensis]SFM69602.1 Signal transduction histidine kinase [Marinobacter zhejiangensis]
MLRTSPARSIRTTLFTWLLPAAVVVIALAWLIHGQLLAHMSRSFAESRLLEEANFIEHQLRKSWGNDQPLGEAGRSVEEVFHHAFAIGTEGQRHISPEIWQPALAPLLASRVTGTISGKAELIGATSATSFLAYRRSGNIDGSPFTIVVAEDLTVLTQGEKSLHLWTAALSGALLLMLIGMIFLAVHLSLRSVKGIQQSLLALQAGERERLDQDTPVEFAPLTGQINGLLDTLEQRLHHSRNALANLSHSIKTPIAAVRQVLEDDQRPLDKPSRQQLVRKLATIDQQLEAELRRERIAGPRIGHRAHPVKQARELLWMLGRLYPDKRFDLTTDLPPDTVWPVDEHDLNEMLGNLLDNAGKWATTQIILELADTGQRWVVRVKDDGPGVEASQLKQLGTRGVRLDQQTPGHGIGLAIVRDLAGRYQGSLTFGITNSGGLEACLELPATLTTP